MSPEELVSRIRERDQARDVAGWRQGDEYDRADYQRREKEAWHAAHENAEEIVRQQERAEGAEQRLMETDAELLRCLQTREADRAAAYEEGMHSVLRQRCIEHRDIPQFNENAHGVGECGACVQDFWRNTYASTAAFARGERLRMLEALKLATDALTIARGWAIDDADARVIAAAVKRVVEVRVDAEDTFAPKVD